MSPRKTHFEQVSLEVVEKILGKEAKQEKQGEGVKPMTAQFDIFRKEQDGGLLWQGTAANLEEAKAVIAKLAARGPGAYLVVDLRTRSELTIQCGGDPGMPPESRRMAS